MNQGRPPSAFRLLVAALTILVLATTIGLYVVFSQAPRGAFSLSIVFFLCLIEVGVGLASVPGMTGLAGGRVSGAGRAILLGALGTYALLGLVTIAVRASLDPAGTPSDSKYLAILFAEGVACFTVAALVLGHDALGDPRELSDESEATRDRFLALLSATSAAVSDFKPLAQEDRFRIDRLQKDLNAIRTTLAHSPTAVGAALAQKAVAVEGGLAQAARGLEGPADLDALERALKQLNDGFQQA